MGDLNVNCNEMRGQKVDKEKKKKNWSDLTPEEMLRGSDLAEVERRCMELCANYIGGAWSCAINPKEDITVKRIAGGLSNQLYYVSLAPHVVTSGYKSVYHEEPHQVTIKFYLPKNVSFGKHRNERLSDTIICCLTSQLGIGPEVYGIFDDGIIQKYYKHVPFKTTVQQENDQLLRLAMHQLARVNHLKVPINKQIKSFSIFNFIEEHIKKAHTELDVRRRVVELELKTMVECDLLEELKSYRDWIDSCDTPVVYCHNDFRGANIMVVGEPNDAQQVVLCDYEYSSYGLRGYDLGSILLEWNGNTYSGESWNAWQIPARPQLERVARFYLEGSDLVQAHYSSQVDNSLDDVIRDAKRGILHNLMFFIAFLLSMRQSFVKALEFDVEENLKKVNTIYKVYQKIKQQLVKEGVICNTS